MSRKMEERNLEQAVTLVCEAGVLPAVSPAAVTAKRSATNKTERIKPQTRLAEPSMKVKDLGTARITKSKKTNRATTRTKSSDKTRLVKTKAVVLVDAPEKRTSATGKTIPTVEAEPQAQRLFQGMGESVDVKAHAAAGREMCFEAEIVVPDETFDEKDDVFASPTDELEVITDRVHIHQATEGRPVTILRWLAGAWKWAQTFGSRHPRKRLRVCETVALGEKRFVAVIEVDGEQFLVGGGSSSVATLARLEPTREFSEVLKRRWAQEPVQA